MEKRTIRDEAQRDGWNGELSFFPIPVLEGRPFFYE